MIPMPEYPKIHSIFKRGEDHKFTNEFSTSEFAYLADNLWEFTEKIDGTNIRVGWDGTTVQIGGRTDKVQIPDFLSAKLWEIFSCPGVLKYLSEGFRDGVTLYGEGFGNRIQKAGSGYIPDGVDFCLFDVRVGHWWLNRDAVMSIADNIGVPFAPLLGTGTLEDAINIVRGGMPSHWGCEAEGIVARPLNGLLDRSGQRIITKIKTRDFK